MKKALFAACMLTCASFMVSCSCECEEEGCLEGCNGKCGSNCTCTKSIGEVTIGFSANHTPDLLELVTPIVTYKDENGMEHNERLNPNMCTLDKLEIPLINGDIQYDERYSWTSKLQFHILKDADLDETISVSYVSNNKTIDPERKYRLAANAGVSWIAGVISNNNKLIVIDHMSLNINIGDNEYYASSVYIGDAVQKYITELVDSKQDFRVEVTRDGAVKINGK